MIDPAAYPIALLVAQQSVVHSALCNVESTYGPSGVTKRSPRNNVACLCPTLVKYCHVHRFTLVVPDDVSFMKSLEASRNVLSNAGDRNVAPHCDADEGRMRSCAGLRDTNDWSRWFFASGLVLAADARHSGQFFVIPRPLEFVEADRIVDYVPRLVDRCTVLRDGEPRTILRFTSADQTHGKLGVGVDIALEILHSASFGTRPTFYERPSMSPLSSFAAASTIARPTKIGPITIRNGRRGLLICFLITTVRDVRVDVLCET
jgi:hypothetical protein